ncbi:hypothetical protein Pth03_20530 [Planotetraspora thailandica]|uniref:Uncharacterized protein n=1 Tax=Planotetraspora thailandica TaxID=487172 RepID=A0A8J3UX48_9ACTN|nr:hypothetical protein [Planotetraspora thailandica]GII53664.1 hypothetical protein Pth03_20530 [Planotetraspora thailandica]
MSKRVIVTLASAAVLSAVVPGLAGYMASQYEALAQTRKELARLQTQLRMAELNVEPAAAVPCGPNSATQSTRELQMPRNTHSRPWQNSGYMQDLSPTIWSSLAVPDIDPWSRELGHHPHHGARHVDIPGGWPAFDHPAPGRSWRER